MTPLSLLLLRSPLLSRLSWLFFLLFHFCLFFFSAVTANCWRWSRTSAWRLGNYWTVPPPSEALCLCVQVIESLLINGVIYHISIERRAAAPAWLHKDYFLQASLQWCWFFFLNTRHGRYREASIQAHVCGNRCFLISCSTLKSANSFCLWYRPANTNTEFVCLCVRACVSGDNYFRIRSILPCACTKKSALAQQYCAPSTQPCCCASNGAKLKWKSMTAGWACGRIGAL